MGGGGAYSPYFGAIVDTAKILSSLHTAHFQYIPALALPTEDALNLRLNMPPSFRDPKSVVVVALPPVTSSRPPLLRPLKATQIFCAQTPGLVLPAEGATLVFVTQFAHDLMLHIETKSGPVDLPVRADPSQGGLVLEHAAPSLDSSENELTGVVRGKWGFDDWEGPRFHLHVAEPAKWTLAADNQSALIVGREDTLHIKGNDSLCVDRIEKQTGSGAVKLAWKSPTPGMLEVVFPMKDAAPGPVSLAIYQFGLEKPDELTLNAYAEAASLDRLTLSAGDTVALLKGTRLDEVAKAELDGTTWTPTKLSRVQDFDRLEMAADHSTAGLEPGKSYIAKVQLRDGRQLQVPVNVGSPRPEAVLLSKGTQPDASGALSPVQLGKPDDLPVEGRLVFFLKSRVPVNFPRDEKVEVAAVDGSFRVLLSLTDGSLILEDAETVTGAVEPLARFGSSAFGPLQIRVVSATGTAGDWLPLGTLVRLPGFKELRCTHAAAKPCTLNGTNLFLVTSVASTPDFDNAIDVPSDFTGTQLNVPHPANGVLYIKLRDDPATVQTLTLPLTSVSQTGLQTAQPPPVAVQ